MIPRSFADFLSQVVRAKLPGTRPPIPVTGEVRSSHLIPEKRPQNLPPDPVPIIASIAIWPKPNHFRIVPPDTNHYYTVLPSATNRSMKRIQLHATPWSWTIDSRNSPGFAGSFSMFHSRTRFVSKPAPQPLQYRFVSQTPSASLPSPRFLAAGSHWSVSAPRTKKNLHSGSNSPCKHSLTSNFQ